ncbi:hypothetical protein JCM10212_003796 [Sporobolomyces blumeae]
MAPPSSSKPHGLSRHATPAEVQAHQLSKLLAHPEKEVHIPKRPTEGVGKTLRPPREMMRNVQGSSAGAGSGEFHVYKQSRRREYERLKLMDEEEAFLKQKKEAEERQRAAEAAAEEKTSKNRLKRQRKKEARSKHKGGKGDEDETGPLPGPSNGTGGAATSDAGDATKKRKLAGGSAMRFKTAEEREEGDGEDEVDALAGSARVPSATELAERDEAMQRLREEEERARPAQEAGIKIQDDD